MTLVPSTLLEKRRIQTSRSSSPCTISDQTRPSSPDSYNGFFYHKFWSEPWSSSDFSPDQAWDRRFLKDSTHWCQGWPWGYFIYRTIYGSDEDWNHALAKLHRYIHCTIRYDDHPEPAEIVWECCKNVIVDDEELLRGASPAKVRQLFQNWVERHRVYNHGSIPRSTFCLMVDNHAIQSILASPEPSLETKNWFTTEVGYVILIDRYFPDKGYRHEPYNVGWVRLKISGVWPFSYSFDTVGFEGRYPGVRKPGLIPYDDSYWTWVEDVNGQKVTAVDSSGDEDEDEDGDDVESGYGIHDIDEYLREGGHI
ncbi:hypothetical protein BDV38DRAFT_288471 [Aspergillus pseudotamarii]|uniref:Uncharacterized protein n=1 Tax=Aspergillus pseudotamarii TaxID=132259 RepID=A0A5N6SDC7_ASPPS|nr:uncharacterized protein BDV38DRAFT_288471 [Aspergillus pseudotamarii]KAE8131681.1 hypothetical protein BDV38DRAFT_288471 [Aspergillus pseudotamarii]